MSGLPDDLTLMADCLAEYRRARESMTQIHSIYTTAEEIRATFEALRLDMPEGDVELGNMTLFGVRLLVGAPR